jgi:hypothetical protein
VPARNATTAALNALPANTPLPNRVKTVLSGQEARNFLRRVIADHQRVKAELQRRCGKLRLPQKVRRRITLEAINDLSNQLAWMAGGERSMVLGKDESSQHGSYGREITECVRQLQGPGPELLNEVIAAIKAACAAATEDCVRLPRTARAVDYRVGEGHVAHAHGSDGEQSVVAG